MGAGFASVKDYTDAFTEGRTLMSHFRKVPSQASTTSWWVDYSMASGNPVPNYYAAEPLVARTLDGNRGIFHGANKAPFTKHLTLLGLMTPTAAMVGLYTLCDYLLFYPFVDGDVLDQQVMDNTVTLPRYTDGAGVQVMAVAVAPTTGGGSFTFDYVNQSGVTRTAPTQLWSTSSAFIASLATSQPGVVGGNAGPFLRLASGDTGVQSILSVTNIASTGGLLSFVLVKPLVDLAVREINTAVEIPFVNNRVGAPQIQDGAYLNLISLCSGSVSAGLLNGYANFIWSD